MRQLKTYIISLLLIPYLVSSCIDDPENISYTLNIETSYQDIGIHPDTEFQITLSNLQNNFSIRSVTQPNEIIQFDSLSSGFYNVTISQKASINGKYYNFNGSADIELFESKTETVEIFGSISNAFVIREFYYSGCLTEAGKAYSSDQYLEIYNNTDTIQYADGISIIEHESYATGINFWQDLNDTIVARMVWSIPDLNHGVPVEPGTGLVISRDAIDHQSDPNGNPICPVNLGNSDFEFYVLKDPVSDIDNPNVTNLDEDLFVYRGIDISFHVRGGSAIAIAKLPGDNFEERQQYISSHLVPKLSSNGTSTRYFAKIANEYILDAVEVTWDEDHAIYRRMPVALDAGYTYVPSGSKSGKCIRRKIEQIIDGRVIYQDTNNSTEDFLKDVEPQPYIYE